MTHQLPTVRGYAPQRCCLRGAEDDSTRRSGGTNVGRALIIGEQLGESEVRARYLLGSQFARDLRTLPDKEYEDVYGSYGVRSHLYAEMVFGNRVNVSQLIVVDTPGCRSMRCARRVRFRLSKSSTRTDLAADEVRRFNPALVDRVPARATIYLPFYVSEFGMTPVIRRGHPSPLR